MMASLAVNEGTIRRHASGDSFQRGQQYYRSGAVLSLVRRGTVLQALVEGSEPEPYRVRCTFDAAGITDAACTCQYAYGGWCKHIVAALLAVVQGEEIEERPSLDALLADLDREELQSLLLWLAEWDPDLSQRLDDEVQLRHSLPAAPAGTASSRSQRRRTPLDLTAVRRQMSAALGMQSLPAYRSGWYSFHLGPEASQLVEQVWAFIRAGEGRSALEILNVMTDEALENWEAIMEDESGEALDFVQETLGPAWIEAILSADLAPNEREGWAAKLDVWASELADYGNSSSFATALRALEEGWDDPALQRILRGGFAEAEHEKGEDYGDLEVLDRLTIARLNVLERQGRLEEYLNLARAEGQVARYAVMLVQEDRAAEATDYGLAQLERTEDALQLAQALRDVGELERALRVGERGLGLEGQKAPLATWLADLAAGMGKGGLAVHAATIAFQEEHSLATYLRVQDLAGEEWPRRREELLSRLRKTRQFYPRGPVEIFLHEGMVDDAIGLIDRDSYPSPDLIEQVADAAIQTHPDWVIRASRKQAEAIMDQKKAEKYDIAARWLAKAKEAYDAAGRQGEWQEYLAALLEEHHRKHKLVPLLRALG
jgi:uncharacterized Zn finger protein